MILLLTQNTAFVTSVLYYLSYNSFILQVQCLFSQVFFSFISKRILCLLFSLSPILYQHNPVGWKLLHPCSLLAANSKELFVTWTIILAYYVSLTNNLHLPSHFYFWLASITASGAKFCSKYNFTQKQDLKYKVCAPLNCILSFIHLALPR